MTETHCTSDDFFRGRLKILQPVQGFRAGMDSVILAASIPAQAGESVLELGMGPGVAALCLAHRVKAKITGVEIDPEAIKITEKNIENNGLNSIVNVLPADVTQVKTIPQRGFDHAMMNPPFYSAAHHQTSPHAQKATAMNIADDALAAWVHTAITCLKPGGSFTAIVPPDRLQTILTAMGAKLGAVQLLAIHTKPNAPATRVLIHGKKGRKTPLAILPPFLTMDDKGGMSEQMRALAEDGGALHMFT